MAPRKKFNVTPRQLELIQQAAQEVQVTMAILQQADAEDQKAKAHFNSVLELSTGQDPMNVEMDVATGTYVLKQAPKRPGKSRGTTKGSKRGKGRK